MSMPYQSTESQHERLRNIYQRAQDQYGLPMMRGPEPPLSPLASRMSLGLRPNALPSSDVTPRGTPTRQRKPLVLPVSSYSPKEPNVEMDKKLQEIDKLTGILEINNKKYSCDIKDLEHVGELGSGTCGLVVKMMHKPSQTVIAVKQMRRSGNSEENKRIIMDLDVVLKSHDCPYIVKCLGCFITESDVWICMELMATCFDKLLKRHLSRIPEDILGKVTLATVRALDYLKEKHGVIHRDVKPSNILLDERGNVKLCDFGISGRLVDSKAQTASAGCAAYLAPERIAPSNPLKPDYDIRADVWSLGITLIELATGVFPYRQCSSDFQVLAEIVTKEPPTLPQDQPFSPQFRSFVTACLTKNYRDRPKYKKLLEHPFIKQAEASSVDVGAWFRNTVPPNSPTRRVQNTRAHSPHRFTAKNPSSSRSTFRTAKYDEHCDLPVPESSQTWQTKNYSFADTRLERSSLSPALGVAARQAELRNSGLPGNVNFTTPATALSYQPLASSGNTASLQRFWNARCSPNYSSYAMEATSYVRRPEICRAVVRTMSPASHVIHTNMSPTPRRAVYTTVPLDSSSNAHFSPQAPVYSTHSIYSNNTNSLADVDSSSSIDEDNKRYSSYLRFNLVGTTRKDSERGRPPRRPSPGLHASNHSPEPPPSFGRLLSSSEDGSPLSSRRLAEHSPSRRSEASPFLARRLVTPSPPLPPPRRLAESNSVPGSPQHHRVERFRTRLHYTPEPQRRIYDSGPPQF